VVPLESFTTPTTSPCRDFEFLLEDRCANAGPGVPCP
jgi:hypothetical protein